MFEVTQTTFHPRGDCYAACIASIFELDLARLPHLPEDDRIILAKFPIKNSEFGVVEDSRNCWWGEMWGQFFLANNLYSLHLDAWNFTNYERARLDFWHVLTGPSPRDPEQNKVDYDGRRSAEGMRHSVVGRKGIVRWDPHPSRAGLLAIDSVELILPRDPTKPMLEGYRNG